MGGGGGTAGGSGFTFSVQSKQPVSGFLIAPKLGIAGDAARDLNRR